MLRLEMTPSETTDEKSSRSYWGFVLWPLAVVLLLMCTAGCASRHDALASGHLYRLFFPHLNLATDDGERIESVEVVVSCGRFRSLAVIPDDWSAEVVSPVSEKTILRASAGHGSSTLWSITDLNR